MPDWSEIVREIQNSEIATAFDVMRRKYLGELSEYTTRNVIAYYSSNCSGIADVLFSSYC